VGAASCRDKSALLIEFDTASILYWGTDENARFILKIIEIISNSI
jgi:hypothetical protein